MTKDPIIEEVRRIRKQIDVETHHDPQEYYERLRKIQRQTRQVLHRGRPRHSALAMAG